MKAIYPNKVYEITADTEDTSFPASNLVDRFPQKVWKTSGGSTGQLAIRNNASSNTVAFFNTNATSIDLAIIPYSESSNNKVLNGDFDDWLGTGIPTDWQKQVSVASWRDTGRVGSGYSVNLVSIAATNRFLYQTITVTPGKAYRFEYYYKNAAGSVFRRGIYDVSNLAWIFVGTADDSTTWSEQQAHLFEAPAGCTSIRIFIGPNTTSQSIWVDDVTLTEEDEVENFTPTRKNIWCEYTYHPGPHDIFASLDCGSGVLYAGLIEAGLAWDFINPERGLIRNHVDYSIVNPFRYGNVYVKKKTVVRQYSGALNLRRDTDLVTFMRKIARKNGPWPIPWLVTDQDDEEWCVYARNAEPVRVGYGIWSHGRAEINLLEMV